MVFGKRCFALLGNISLFVVCGLSSPSMLQAQGVGTSNFQCNEDVSATARIAAPNSGIVGQSVNFTASATIDSNRTIVSYLWDFGEGPTRLGPKVSHVFTTVGTQKVTLAITDNCGKIVSTTVTIPIATVFPITTASPIPPLPPPTHSCDIAVDFYVPDLVLVNQVFTLFLRTSVIAPGTAVITSYEVNFGDGTPLEKANNTPIPSSGFTHTYSQIGSYKIKGKISGYVRGGAITCTTTPPPTFYPMDRTISVGQTVPVGQGCDVTTGPSIGMNPANGRVEFGQPFTFTAVGGSQGSEWRAIEYHWTIDRQQTDGSYAQVSEYYGSSLTQTYVPAGLSNEEYYDDFVAHYRVNLDSRCSERQGGVGVRQFPTLTRSFTVEHYLHERSSVPIGYGPYATDGFGYNLVLSEFVDSGNGRLRRVAWSTEHYRDGGHDAVIVTNVDDPDHLQLYGGGRRRIKLRLGTSDSAEIMVKGEIGIAASDKFVAIRAAATIGNNVTINSGTYILDAQKPEPDPSDSEAIIPIGFIEQRSSSGPYIDRARNILFLAESGFSRVSAFDLSALANHSVQGSPSYSPPLLVQAQNLGTMKSSFVIRDLLYVGGSPAGQVNGLPVSKKGFLVFRLKDNNGDGKIDAFELIPQLDESGGISAVVPFRIDGGGSAGAFSFAYDQAREILAVTSEFSGSQWATLYDVRIPEHPVQLMDRLKEESLFRGVAIVHDYLYSCDGANIVKYGPINAAIVKRQDIILAQSGGCQSIVADSRGLMFSANHDSLAVAIDPDMRP